VSAGECANLDAPPHGDVGKPVVRGQGDLATCCRGGKPGGVSLVYHDRDPPWLDVQVARRQHQITAVRPEVDQVAVDGNAVVCLNGLRDDAAHGPTVDEPAVALKQTDVHRVLCGKHRLAAVDVGVHGPTADLVIPRRLAEGQVVAEVQGVVVRVPTRVVAGLGDPIRVDAVQAEELAGHLS